MRIAYISYNQLMDDIRDNLWKIPRDTDLVLSVPRSGTAIAGIITKYLNVNMMTIQEFCGVVLSGGGEEELKKRCFKGRALILNKSIKNILVVDDTIYSGGQMNVWRTELTKDAYKNYSFTLMAVYKEWTVEPDLYLKDISNLAASSPFKSVLYEWTLWYRYDISQYLAFDLDGVLCLDPPSDENKDAYEEYIRNPIPYHLPAIPKGGFNTTVITYRIEPYREITANWLSSLGILGNLYMVNAKSREERNQLVTPWDYKAYVYGNNPNLLLYVESNDYEAQMIHQITKKPVLCISTNKLYQTED